MKYTVKFTRELILEETGIVMIDADNPEDAEKKASSIITDTGSLRICKVRVLSLEVEGGEE